MPQLDVSTFTPQLVWLAISFIALYLLMSRLGLPRVDAIIAARRSSLRRSTERWPSVSADDAASRGSGILGRSRGFDFRHRRLEAGTQSDPRRARCPRHADP